MNVVSQLCRDVSLPKMVKVKQNFCRDSIKKENVASVVNKELSREQIKREIKPGMRVAITCGSRGIANIAIMIKAMVEMCIRDRCRRLHGSANPIRSNTAEGHNASARRVPRRWQRAVTVTSSQDRWLFMTELGLQAWSHEMKWLP